MAGQAVFSKSRMEVHWGRKHYEHPCEVKIDAESIAVSYYDDGFVVYHGHKEGAGHYRLTAVGVTGRASLHRFDGDNVLEGWWTENGVGAWRIFLED